jgi:acyl-[acyl-carrier-protein]-phospholipid O-acyltransferase/long-chain-fatty-acid--[acyl-carrier-protein] ligase
MLAQKIERKLDVLHAERIPGSGGFLVLPSRLDLAEARKLQSLLGDRDITWLTVHGAPLAAGLEAFLHSENTQAIAFVPGDEHLEAFRATLNELTRKGHAVIHVPSETTSLNALPTTVPGAQLEFLCKAGVPVLPLQVHRRAEIQISIGGGDDRSVLAFGAVLDAGKASAAACQAACLELAEECFSMHPFLDLSLPYALIKGFKKHGGRTRIVDGKDEKILGFDKIFAVSIALSRHLKAETSQQRVAIVLPPGIGGLIANIAVLLAGKIPVNLNFTASHASIKSAIRQSGVDRFITADPFVRKMQSFPWPPNRQMILIERLLPQLKPRIVPWLILSKLLPASLIASVLGVDKKGGHREALLLFTSGSSGDPKGVPLTHCNLLANVAQFGSRLNLRDKDAILACLPLFHSFGSTVTLWYPVIEGVSLVSYPSPLETKRLAELVEKYRATLMLATPTFLRGYLRGVPREQLSSLRMVITGAEKLPPSVSQAFEAKFGHKVLEGYGLTETSPVSNVNLPDPGPEPALPAHRPGSTGQLMPGLAMRITHPETGEPLPLNESGIIWFKGPNVFTGYLDDPKRTADVLNEDGWFRTGDMGRLDADGFLHIEGRLSRFSKIAGEMIPHETVEEAINKALGLDGEDSRRIAVVGIPDPERGEALVLLSTLPCQSEQQAIVELRHRLIDAGIPALWVPKVLKLVEEIPILSSGKLDVQGCSKLARG